MSNDPTSKIITKVINDFVEDGKMFSAFDVTTKIRGMGVYCKHNAIKTDIHSAMSDVMDEGSENYEKTLVDTGSYRTFVYHKSTDDPYTYKSDTDGSTATVAPKAVATPAPKTNSVIAGQSAGRDNRGRVCLPADMLRNIGATIGKKVVISPKNGEVQVTNYNPKVTTSKEDHVYKVDRDNNVRISAGVLAKAKLGVQKGFAVEQTTDSIKVY